VDNVFNLHKKILCEFNCKTSLHVVIVPNLVTYCCILHNMSFGCDEINVQNVL
jgi:hypothetical protein